ncbi:ABC transporter permease subunit, partial [bacterium]|nr:ABC transporter permease subunit [bacterium]
INFRTWINLLYAGGLTFLRVMGASLIALLWTVPVGVAIGMNKKLAKSFQPVVQIFASIPATAFFPVIFFYFLRHNFSNLNLSAIIIMLLGSQWYLLFNVIAGASSIPETLKTTSSLLFLSKKEKWKVLILPAIFPNVVTGLITATGGSWNVSIIAEYVHFSAQTYKVKGLGSMIVEATAKGDYNLLFAATLSMIIIVVLINRFVWRKLYDFAEERYRMEF